MKAELTLPPELVDLIADKVIEKLKPLIAVNGSHNPKDRWFNVKELSAYISMSTQWIYNHKNKLPHSNINNKPLFRKSEIDTWLEGYRAVKPEDIKYEKDPIKVSIFNNQKGRR
jgi:predicted DNA-binding transcriptional regulator AlpA